MTRVARKAPATRACALTDFDFDRQPVPSSCHVDQNGLHSRIWRTLRHLPTFRSVCLTLDRIHNPTPPNCLFPPKQQPRPFDELEIRTPNFQSAVSFWSHPARGGGAELGKQMHAPTGGRRAEG